jgi:hypothetical protein
MMDVVKFFREFRRMCKSTSDCTKCEYHGDKCDNAIELFEKTVAEVEQRSREHPRKTRQDVFLEQYPEADLTKDGAISICPISVSAAYRNKTGGCASPTRPQCGDCMREFWTQEVE